MGVESSGGSPAPATSSAPTPSSGGETSSPSATTQKIDYGMGASKPSEPSQGGELYGESWWKTHGEHVFKHPRVKEALGWKKKYEEVSPLIELVEGYGNTENLKLFSQHFGPVWKYLNSLGEKGGERWQQLYPVLNKFLQGGDLQEAIQNRNAEGFEDSAAQEDPEKAELKSRLESIEGKYKSFEQKEQEKTRKSNLLEYKSMIDESFAKEGLPDNLKKIAVKLISNDILKYMPKDNQGRPLNPLDHVSKEAFDAVMEQSVLSALKEMEGYAVNKITKSSENDGPILPDASRGQTPGPRQGLSGRHEKVQRLTQFMKTGR